MIRKIIKSFRFSEELFAHLTKCAEKQQMTFPQYVIYVLSVGSNFKSESKPNFYRKAKGTK